MVGLFFSPSYGCRYVWDRYEYLLAGTPDGWAAGLQISTCHARANKPSWAALLYIVEPNCKNPPKNKFKNSWNCQVILMPATIWQVLNVKCTQSPETEIIDISWNLFGKNSWKHNKWRYFVADFTHLEPLCGVETNNCSCSCIKILGFVQKLLHGMLSAVTIFSPNFAEF